MVYLSCAGNFFICLTILNDKKLREHPMQIFGWISFCFGSLFWIYATEPWLCPQDKTTLFYAATFPYTLDATEQEQFNWLMQLTGTLG